MARGVGLRACCCFDRPFVGVLYGQGVSVESFLLFCSALCGGPIWKIFWLKIFRIQHPEQTSTVRMVSIENTAGPSEYGCRRCDGCQDSDDSRFEDSDDSLSGLTVRIISPDRSFSPHRPHLFACMRHRPTRHVPGGPRRIRSDHVKSCSMCRADIHEEIAILCVHRKLTQHAILGLVLTQCLQFLGRPHVHNKAALNHSLTNDPLISRARWQYLLWQARTPWQARTLPPLIVR